MLERLIEVWTDSVNERTYQPAFLQMLISQGHSIVHNTRHGALEFGKDVVSKNAEGDVCAFQLKGHPGGRLRKRDVPELIPQLNELVFARIVHPNVDRKVRHRSFLVTNGEVDEEALHELIAMYGDLPDTSPAKSFHVISRGDFLRWAKALEGNLWPGNVNDWKMLLEFVGVDGAETLAHEKFLRLLDAAIGVPKKNEVRRRISSAALFASLALRNYSMAGNFAAEAEGWALFASRALAVSERTAARSKAVDALVDAAETAVKDSLLRLMSEAQARPAPIELGLPECAVYGARLALLCGVAGLLSFWLEGDSQRQELRGFVEKHITQCRL